MPEQLVSALEDLAKGIAVGSFRSEAEISQGVVKRVLHELEWPVFNVQVVTPEFKIGSRKVDYALCHPPGKPSVLLEVKDLGKADSKGQRQLFEYCFHQGVPIAVLTDGQTWSFFFPAGQGSYEERQFARINLLEDDGSDAAGTLQRYLNVSDVRSGAARKRAERDYERVRFQKEAASKYASVWRELLSQPEPSLLDLFSQRVEAATQVRPDPERAAAFIRTQIGIAEAPPGTQTPSPKEKPPTAVPPQVQPDAAGDKPSFTFQGSMQTFDSGAELLGAVFRRLASMDPDFCRRYSEKHYGRVRQYVAKSRERLYPGKPSFQKYSCSLPGGWWIATHCSNTDKLKRIKQACKLAGLEFGGDVVVQIPVGSKKTAP